MKNGDPFLRLARIISQVDLFYNMQPRINDTIFNFMTLHKWNIENDKCRKEYTEFSFLFWYSFSGIISKHIRVWNVFWVRLKPVFMYRQEDGFSDMSSPGVLLVIFALYFIYWAIGNGKMEFLKDKYYYFHKNIQKNIIPLLNIQYICLRLK
jgi:hypothetical protein